MEPYSPPAVDPGPASRQRRSRSCESDRRRPRWFRHTGGASRRRFASALNNGHRTRIPRRVIRTLWASGHGDRSMMPASAGRRQLIAVAVRTCRYTLCCTSAQRIQHCSTSCHSADWDAVPGFGSAAGDGFACSLTPVPAAVDYVNATRKFELQIV